MHALEGNGRREGERGFILDCITLTLSYLNFIFFLGAEVGGEEWQACHPSRGKIRLCRLCGMGVLLF